MDMPEITVGEEHHPVKTLVAVCVIVRLGPGGDGPCHPDHEYLAVLVEALEVGVELVGDCSHLLHYLGIRQRRAMGIDTD